ncbi:hypothetical protein A2477_01150 [Candidatus Falkowbacteria bacterium RIFOXYC2_FULL_47_12]|uniref:Uncharacterized protein n=2 Tax=Candidatus Falkowiibacteriota TaxID=1752728 RepID=A0A1F5TQY2_9BACT|nr:MAG: hypothetical protein A2242_01480 [Candidatus Falkowbacteria bacterium RIFOXYA2_FULL_47_9]OGF41207.1 MAG: hypothetical protein A2477_01150 [Candidatus Falkowbacteria bacterium RIFOXYC2_FULL_47_12]
MPKDKLKICLETSTYLPLTWTTPYSQDVINLIQYYRNDADFYIQDDCLTEALSYIHYQKNWFRHASVRIKKIAKILTDKQLNELSFPSTAFQILLGGKMWAQGLYLNFVRHTTFLYADLVDKVDFSDKRKGLLKLAGLIDERFEELQNKIEGHLIANEFEINFREILPYWGKFYLFMELPGPLKVKVWKIEEKFEKGPARIRDVFHYKSMIDSNIGFNKMIVANTGFSAHIKKELGKLEIELLCAKSRQMEIYE